MHNLDEESVCICCPADVALPSPSKEKVDCVGGKRERERERKRERELGRDRERERERERGKPIAEEYRSRFEVRNYGNGGRGWGVLRAVLCRAQGEIRARVSGVRVQAGWEAQVRQQLQLQERHYDQERGFPHPGRSSRVSSHYF